MASNSRADALYTLGMAKYHELADDAGTSNALLAAVAAMIADSERVRTWKTPALLGDPHEAEPTTDETTFLERPTKYPVGTSRKLGNW